MLLTVDIHEVPARWDELVAQAAAGAEIVLTDGQVPRVKLVPFAPAQTRIAGLHDGAIQTSADFDAPLPDVFWAGTP